MVRKNSFKLLALLSGGAWAVVSAGTRMRHVIDLPSRNQIVRPVPGGPQRLNSLPMSMAVSADGRYVVTVNAGYGTYESEDMQSLAVLDTQTGGGCGRSRRCIRGWRSAGMGGICTRVWVRRRTRWEMGTRRPGVGWWCMG